MRLLHIGWLAIPLWSSMQDNRFNMLNKEQQLILYFIINQSATYKNDVQGAAVVLLEHRFYGHSRPTNNTRLTRPNWARKVREKILFSVLCTVYCGRGSVSLESERGKELA